MQLLALLTLISVVTSCCVSGSELGIKIYTGDKEDAGTTAGVHIVLHGDNGESSNELYYGSFFGAYFWRSRADEFVINKSEMSALGVHTTLSHAELWTSGWILNNSWYVDRIAVENAVTGAEYIFPIQRWVNVGKHYFIDHLDTALPQQEKFPEQREAELQRKFNEYQFSDRGGFVLVDKLPTNEKYLPEHLEATKRSERNAKWNAKKYLMFTGNAWFWKEWKSLKELSELFDVFGYREPKHVDDWDDDVQFGRQRLEGTNTNLIELVTSLPDKFPITDDMVHNLLDGMSLREAVQQKRLFITDLHILDGIPTRDEDTIICAPIALFFNDEKNDLRPIAIQLFQTPGKSNPIFTPNDPVKTWSFVKMWYKNADMAYQSGIVHLGKTHFLMEGVIASTHRHVSQSHPVYKILAPHFLYTLQVAKMAEKNILAPGAGLDKVASNGLEGMMTLIEKAFSDMKMNVITYLPEDLKRRGVDDMDILPNYHSRNDALLLHTAIEKYVQTYVDLYYTHQDLLHGDVEIQGWVREMATPRADGGVGVSELPGQGQMTNKGDLTKLLTSIIYTCSVGHSVTNDLQYDEYGFVPNSAGVLRGTPPTTPEDPVTQDDILAALPEMTSALSQIALTWAFSNTRTNSLGDFETDYIYDPKAVAVVEQFREDLKAVSEQIKDRNLHRKSPYTTLLPENVRNAISG